MTIRKLISDVVKPLTGRSHTVRKHKRTSNYRRSGRLVIEAFETRDLMAADLPGIGERPGNLGSQNNRPVIAVPANAVDSSGVGNRGDGGPTFDRPTLDHVIDASNTDLNVDFDSGNDGHLLLADPPVQLRLNDNMDTFTETIVPEVVGDLIGGSMKFDDYEILEGSIEDIWITKLLPVCHGISWNLSLVDITAWTPIGAETVDINFENRNEIEVDIDMDAFRVSADLELFLPASDNLICNAFANDWRISIPVSATGLHAEVDVVVESDPNTSTVSVTDIEKSEVFIDSVDVDIDELNETVDTVINVAQMLGFLRCGDLDECINDEIDKQLENKRWIENWAIDLVNSSINTSLAIDDSVSVDNFDVDYSVGLSTISTSDEDDRLTTFWDVDITSDEDPHVCADDFSTSNYRPIGNYDTGEDIEVIMPFSVVGDAIYEVGKQGAFCRYFSTEHGGTDLTVGVKPDGAFKIESGASNSSDSLIVFDGTPNKPGTDAIHGLLPDIVPQEERIVFTLPVAIQVSGGGSLGSIPSLPNLPNIGNKELTYDFEGDITGDVVMTTALTLNQSQGLDLDFHSIDFTNASGDYTVEVGHATVDVPEADLTAWIEDELDEFLNVKIPSIPLLPQVIDFAPNSDYQLSMNVIESLGDSIGIGFGIEIKSEEQRPNDDGPGGGRPGGADVPPVLPPVDLGPIDVELEDVFGEGDDEPSQPVLISNPIPEFFPGDANGDGAVDFADFLALSGNFGMTNNAQQEHGDFDANGEVNFSDFLILSKYFGQRS